MRRVGQPQPLTPVAILGDHAVRIRKLEFRHPLGRWVYVGTFPGDPDTTATSPPFLNGWENVGGGQQRLRFRLTNDNQTEIVGVVTGGVDAAAVVNLPDRYRPGENQPSPGVGGTWLFKSDGDLVFTSA